MKLLLPDQILPKVTDINLSDLEQLGISGLLLDLDNTLVKYDSEELGTELKSWLTSIMARGFKICLVSNGKPRRVKRFARILGIPAVIHAFKPKRSPFWRALNILKLSPHEVAMVGDQMFTDVLGANRIGIYTILINPLSEKEFRTTRMVRKLEYRMLRRFVNKGLLTAESVIKRNGEIL